jgi:hypothetical protein
MNQTTGVDPLSHSLDTGNSIKSFLISIRSFLMANFLLWMFCYVNITFLLNNPYVYNFISFLSPEFCVYLARALTNRRVLLMKIINIVYNLIGIMGSHGEISEDGWIDVVEPTCCVCMNKIHPAKRVEIHGYRGVRNIDSQYYLDCDVRHQICCGCACAMHRANGPDDEPGIRCPLCQSVTLVRGLTPLYIHNKLLSDDDVYGDFKDMDGNYIYIKSFFGRTTQYDGLPIRRFSRRLYDATSDFWFGSVRILVRFVTYMKMILLNLDLSQCMVLASAVFMLLCTFVFHFTRLFDLAYLWLNDGTLVPLRLSHQISCGRDYLRLGYRLIELGYPYIPHLLQYLIIIRYHNPRTGPLRQDGQRKIRLYLRHPRHEVITTLEKWYHYILPRSLGLFTLLAIVPLPVMSIIQEILFGTLQVILILLPYLPILIIFLMEYHSFGSPYDFEYFSAHHYYGDDKKVPTYAGWTRYTYAFIDEAIAVRVISKRVSATNSDNLLRYIKGEVFGPNDGVPSMQSLEQITLLENTTRYIYQVVVMSLMRDDSFVSNVKSRNIPITIASW